MLEGKRISTVGKVDSGLFNIDAYHNGNYETCRIYTIVYYFDTKYDCKY